VLRISSFRLLFLLPKSSFGRDKLSHGHRRRNIKMIRCQLQIPFRENFIPPKRRFWTDWQKMKSRFSIYLSMVWVLDLGYEPLQSISKNPDFIFCQSFQNLRLGSINLLYSIWATQRWKVLRKRTTKCLSDLPKSSFGKGKIFVWEHNFVRKKKIIIASVVLMYTAKWRALVYIAFVIAWRCLCRTHL
jgi:hypothetical protein